MDLLQGYGSDEDSHSSSSSSVEERRPDDSLTKTGNDMKVTRAAAATTTTVSNNNDYKRKKKGTRLLKLNSVLPPDILERLTRSTVQHAASSGSKSNMTGTNNNKSSWNKYDYDSSDDSSDDNSKNDDNINNKKESITKNNNNDHNRRNKEGDESTSKKSFLTQTSNNIHKNIGGDLGLDSLLSDLQSVAPTSSIPNVPKSNSNNDNGKMGLAFMNVSNTVVRTKKTSSSSVVDIHGSTSMKGMDNKNKNHFEVEDVHTDDDNDNNEVNDLSNDAIPLFPSSRKRPNEEEDNINSSMLSNPVGNQYKNSNSIKRPRHTVTAAPTLPSNFQTLKVPSYNTNHDMSLQSTTSNQQKYYHEQQQQQQYYENEQQVNQSTIKPTKMSKRELEKALRSGNFDAIDSSNITQSIDTSSYNAPSENEILATASTSNPNGSQYRTSNLQMYVPSEGASVATGDVSSKQRSKHQIHSLVANARKLEADRARLGAMGLGGRKSNRADAKKKYGW